MYALPILAMDRIYIKNSWNSFVCFLKYFKKKLENITKEERSKLNTNIEAFNIFPMFEIVAIKQAIM